MLFKTLLLSLYLLGSATAYPSSSTDNALLARSIDPSGPIPADAVPISGGGFSFSADSDTAHWVRAQTSSGSDLTKRGSSGLSIAIWTNFGCSGSGAFFPNVQYGVQSVGSILYYQSIQFNGRALLGNEQLDFSQQLVLHGDKCAHYIGSAPNRLGAGCFDEGAFSCFRLLSF